MLGEILTIIGLTLTPSVELRGSIPVGIFFTSVPLWAVLIIVFISNIIAAVLAYYVFLGLIVIFRKIKWIDKCYAHYVERTQKRIQKYVDKWGIFGLSVFIGIPVPGSGVYTAAVAADLFGIKFKHYLIASTIGVLIAGTIVTLISLGGLSLIS